MDRWIALEHPAEKGALAPLGRPGGRLAQLAGGRAARDAERDRARYDKEKTAYQLKQRESVIGTEDDGEYYPIKASLLRKLPAIS